MYNNYTLVTIILVINILFYMEAKDEEGKFRYGTKVN